MRQPQEAIIRSRSETIEASLWTRDDLPLVFAFTIHPDDLYPVRLEALVRSLAALLCPQYPCTVRGTVATNPGPVRILCTWQGDTGQVANAAIAPKWRALVRNEIHTIESRLEKARQEAHNAPAAPTLPPSRPQPRPASA